ncbi:helix-turn-helix domain-containing protein [Paenibacillus sp. MABNR03]|uniref:helix-turn-helix domain-containing protein n=1 Tax=Paenibacillus sp. MABNR03 TaxID=3142626 RepID=UPI003D297A32
MPTLGERIKQLREMKGYSQKELSERTNLTIVQLSRYETNHRKPDPEALCRLANNLGTSADYLIGLSSEPLQSPVRELDQEFSSYLEHPIHGVFLRNFFNAPDQLKNETLQFFNFVMRNYDSSDLE